MTDRSDLDLGQQSGSDWNDASENQASPAEQIAQATTSTADSAAQPDEQPVVKSELNETVIVDEDDLPNATGQQRTHGFIKLIIARRELIALNDRATELASGLGAEVSKGQRGQRHAIVSEEFPQLLHTNVHAVCDQQHRASAW